MYTKYTVYYGKIINKIHLQVSLFSITNRKERALS